MTTSQLMYLPNPFGEKMEWKIEEDVSPCTSPQHLYPSPQPQSLEHYNNEFLNTAYESLFTTTASSLITTNTLFNNCSFDDNIYKYESSINLLKDPLKDENNADLQVESKAQVASKLLDDLDHLEHLDQWIKEEPVTFSDWLEEKIDLPIFGDEITNQTLLTSSIKVRPVLVLPTTIQQQNEIPNGAHQYISKSVPNLLYNHPVSQNINDNVKDESVLERCGGVAHAAGNNTTASLAANTQNVIGTTTDTQTLLQEFETVFEQVEMTLTPPQSPQNSIFTTMQPVQIIQPDVAKELAVVDELVRCRAEGLVYSWDENSSSSSSAIPMSPSTSSYSGGDESTDDPEWIPETVSKQVDQHPTTIKPSKKSYRTKPYDRLHCPEDKKSRKKEQNKNAATRYRQKKKAEIAVILTEEKGLQEINDKLQTEVNDLSREIKYLKGLMRDLFKAKGLVQ